jgi:exonuclease III
MKLASYNFCQGGANYDACYRILQKLDADIVLGQELRAPHEYLSKAARTWRDLGYQDPVYAQVPSNEWGSAIFLKKGTAQVISIPDHLFGWIVGVVITGREWVNPDCAFLKVFSVHTPTRKLNNDYFRQAQEVLDFLQTQGVGKQTILGGDFNVTISNQHPSNPTQRFVDFFRSTLGVLNCWQIINANQPLPRTFHGTPTSNQHIDGIFISPDWYRYLQSSWIVGSQKGDWPDGDHYPVICEYGDSAIPR